MPAYRALQNPGLFKYEHYRQAALAVCAGIFIRFLIAVPVSSAEWISDHPNQSLIKIRQIIVIKAGLWSSAFFVNFDSVTWDDHLVGGMDFLANSVLQVPFFLMSLMRYITPTLDHM